MPAVKGAEIRRRRQRLGLKLGEFAKVSGVGYKVLANIEACSRPTSIEVVYRLAHALGAEAEDLLVNAADAA
jgi:transcriptional regulator with XRE-family HTH domain